MSEKPGIIFRFLSSTLLVTSVGVTLILLIIGYQLALWLLAKGITQGQTSMYVLGGLPSLCAVLSWPFWMTFRRMNRQV